MPWIHTVCVQHPTPRMQRGACPSGLDADLPPLLTVGGRPPGEVPGRSPHLGGLGSFVFHAYLNSPQKANHWGKAKWAPLVPMDRRVPLALMDSSGRYLWQLTVGWRPPGGPVRVLGPAESAPPCPLKFFFGTVWCDFFLFFWFRPR
jgi:hypothetical protein